MTQASSQIIPPSQFGFNINDSINLMADLETTSTQANAGILAVALVPFLSGIVVDPFYARNSLKSVEQNRFHIERSTMDWWTRQPAEVRAEAFGGTEHIETNMLLLADYVASLKQIYQEVYHRPPATVTLWGNGSDFDCTILAETYDNLDLQYPFDFKQHRCYRTLKNLFPGITPVTSNDKKHTAIGDAMWQAEHATHILMNLNKAFGG